MSCRLSRLAVVFVLFLSASIVQAEPRRDADGVALPDGALVRLGSTRFRHGAAVTSLAYTHDGKFLATGCNDHVIRLWDPSTGQEVRRFVGHDGEVRCIAFSVLDERRLESLHH